ncbi:MAG: 16S rRNA (uracil(1498)-N(3))-methyltransferase [Gammaproteobacteria bacterium]|nr:16S rRNA (uracil(1498)-N(3))-methyltransferase [Gammaproteobacteria bacterium]
MRISRVYLPLPLQPQTDHHINGQTAHYLSRVLRLKKGHLFHAFNGEGGEYLCEVTDVDKKSLQFKILRFLNIDKESPLIITLLQAISKGDRMTYAIQKAVELGVTKIHPVITTHCEISLKGEQAKKKLSHWQTLANSACEQCGRNRIVSIKPITVLKKVLPTLNSQCKLLLDAQSSTSISKLTEQPDGVSLLIGPEGGLHADEIKYALTYGFHTIRIGPRILRTETATAAALTSIQMLWGDFRS